MKTLTVRVPEKLFAEIDAEARLRKVSKSDVARERLQQSIKPTTEQGGSMMQLISDLIGTVDGLPSDLSARKKHYLRASGYGKNRNRR